MRMLCSTAFLVFLLTACAGPRPQLPSVPAAEVLLRKLEETGQRWQQLDAAAEVGFKRNGKSLSSRQFMLLEKPDRLRVDVLSFFGQPVLQLTVDQGELQVFLGTTTPGQYYRGPASDEVLARFTRLPLRASELVRLLLYDPPQPQHQSVRVEVAEEYYLLRLLNGNRQQQFFFDEQKQLRRCIYLHNGKSLLIVNYDRIDKKDGFPRRVQIEMPAQKLRVSVVFSDIRLNQAIEDSRFILNPPANAIPLLLPKIDQPEERS